ncbi:MAG: RibD family protein [Chloroflexota bacterium]
MLPRVILHNASSVDGRMDWCAVDLGLYYELAARWNVDAILGGSNTMLAAPGQQPDRDDETFVPERVPDDPRPLLAVVDSQGRIHNWNFWRKQPYWRDVLVLCSRATPRVYLDELQNKRVNYFIAGDDRVDLRAALEELNTRYGVQSVRVDSGGVLNGVLLRAGLVGEVSILFTPSLVGGMTPRSIFTAPDLASADGVVPLKLTHVEKLNDDVVWIRYQIAK